MKKPKLVKIKECSIHHYCFHEDGCCPRCNEEGIETPEVTIADLSLGSRVRSLYDNRIFTVTGNYGSRATATATVDITNPSEWEIV